jgi:DNA-binding response OmpR family regulator
LVQRRADGRVLVVDDEDSVRGLLQRVLEAEGYDVVAAADAASARSAISSTPPDVVILDVMLAGDDGLNLLADLRRTSEVGVILLTARGEESDRIVGLKMGADDYVVKPFSPGELVARIDSVLRRSRPRAAAAQLDFGDLRVDLTTREVFVGGSLVETTAKEFDLLVFLASSPRQVFTRNQLLEHVWESSAAWQDPATVTEHVRRIRRKIEPDPDQPRWVRTVRGVGYRFEP